MKKFFIFVCLIGCIISINAQSSHFDNAFQYDRRWLMNIDFGMNIYSADYTKGGLSARTTPQYNFGIGHWSLPFIGFKFQITGFSSKSHKYVEGLYTWNSEIYEDKKGNKFWKEHVKWADCGIEMMIDINNLLKKTINGHFLGKEGHFIVGLGIGVTHHWGFQYSYNSANEWSGRLELQYSHIMGKNKAWSLDAKMRLLLYETMYDGVINNQKLDRNIALCFGATYFIKKSKSDKQIKQESNINTLEMHNILKENINDEVNEIRKLNDKKENQFKEIEFPFIVPFVEDSRTLSYNDKIRLRRLSQMMKTNSCQKYLIIGHFKDYNVTSEQRAAWMCDQRINIIKRILIDEYGVPKDQIVISVLSKGADISLFGNNLPNGVIITECN